MNKIFKSRDPHSAARSIVLRAAALTLSLIILLAIAAPCLSASADGTYSIPSADFYVELLPDGSAEIRETWELTYSGSFHRFRHGFLQNMPKAQSFDSLVVSEYRINGTVVSSNNAGDDMSAEILYDNNERQLCWYKTIDGSESVTYEAVYKLSNVVKSYGGKPIVSCRFVGANFQKSINNLNIYLKNSSGLKLEDTSSNTTLSDPGENGDYIVLAKVNSDGLCAVTFTFDKNSANYFTSKLESVSKSDLKKALKKGSSADADNALRQIPGMIGRLIFNPTLFFLAFVVMAVRRAKFRGGSGGGGGHGCSSYSCGGGSSCGGGCGGGGCGGGGCGGGGAD